jgi:hypothetical protein
VCRGRRLAVIIGTIHCWNEPAELSFEPIERWADPSKAL